MAADARYRWKLDRVTAAGNMRSLPSAISSSGAQLPACLLGQVTKAECVEPVSCGPQRGGSPGSC